MLTRNRKDTVAWRCTSKREDINAGMGIDSDRTCSTLSSTGTTKITAQGEWSGLSARKGERSSPTRLLMDPGDYCSLQFLSDPSQSYFRAPQQGRLTAAPPAQRRGGCQAVLVSGRREPWQAGLVAPGVATDRQSEGQTSIPAAMAPWRLPCSAFAGESWLPKFRA